MTLKRRLLTHLAATIAGVLLLGTAATLGVRGLRQDFTVALQANDQLRDLYTLGSHVAVARSAVAHMPPALTDANVELSRATTLLDLMLASAARPWVADTRADAVALRDALSTLAARLRSADSPSPAFFDDAYARLATLSTATQSAIHARQLAADRRHHLTLAAVGAIALATTLLVLYISRRQYRAVLDPLTHLRHSVRRIAAGELSERVPTTGADAEFSTLATDFNRMAADLQSVHADLEERIETKSRQLAASQRLASVGTLAAGVAHEINNPLAIIAGYAERAAHNIDRSTDDATTADFARNALSVIASESFRCKQITDRLLQFARPASNDARSPVHLAPIIRDVTASLTSLDRFAHRSVTLDLPNPSDLPVQANEGELRQILMNLLTNALEATAPDTGHVHLALSHTPTHLTLTLTDNGTGISPQSLPHIFEPFFTQKHNPDHPNTGLGLAVARSLTESHQGTLHASSPGPNQGSTFTLTLPTAPLPTSNKQLATSN